MYFDIVQSNLNYMYDALLKNFAVIISVFIYLCPSQNVKIKKKPHRLYGGNRLQ